MLLDTRKYFQPTFDGNKALIDAISGRRGCTLSTDFVIDYVTSLAFFYAMLIHAKVRLILSGFCSTAEKSTRVHLIYHAGGATDVSPSVIDLQTEGLKTSFEKRKIDNCGNEFNLRRNTLLHDYFMML